MKLAYGLFLATITMNVAEGSEVIKETALCLADGFRDICLDRIPNDRSMTPADIRAVEDACRGDSTFLRAEDTTNEEIAEFAAGFVNERVYEQTKWRLREEGFLPGNNDCGRDLLSCAAIKEEAGNARYYLRCLNDNYQPVDGCPLLYDRSDQLIILGSIGTELDDFGFPIYPGDTCLDWLGGVVEAFKK